jgi:hypothetical protein
MKRSHAAPGRTKKPARAPTSASPAEAPAPPPALLLTPTSVHLWHTAAHDALLDLAALAREGARRPHRRVLSRGEIRRQAREAFAKLRSLLDLALTPLLAAASSPQGGSHAR